MRLLANKHPSLRAVVHDRLEDEIASLFGEHLHPTEREQLQLCRQLRNKLLHCDFVRARSRLHALGAPEHNGGVRQVELDLNRDIAPQLMTAIENPRASRSVVPMTSKSEADVYGWLLELGAAGDLLQAVSAFQSASATISRLAELDDQDE